MSKSKGPSTQTGFTLVEVLFVAPIVVLVIGILVSMMVTMTGEVVATRAKNALVYNTQSALDQIEQDIKASSEFLAGNDFALMSPQGYADGAGTINTDFENVDATTGTMLILRSFTTDKNPLDTTRVLIYIDDQPYDCTQTTLLARNTPFTSNIVYFIKSNTLWRRTLVWQGGTAPASLCGVAWQQPSCQPGVTRGSYCKVDDQRMLDNVNTFTAQYYTDASSDIEDTVAVDEGQSYAIRSSAIGVDDTVKVTLGMQQTIAGRTISQTNVLRATKTNTVSTP